MPISQRRLRNIKRLAASAFLLLTFVAAASVPAEVLAQGTVFTGQTQTQTIKDQEAKNAATIPLGGSCPDMAEGANCNSKPSGFKCTNGVCTEEKDAATAPAKEKVFEPIKPVLSIPIPNLKFSDIPGVANVEVPWLAEYVSAVYKFAIGIASVVAAIMMMIGGFQYLTAGGDAGRVTQAKERIKDAIIGLGLALGAYSILYTVNPELLSLKGASTGNIARLEYTDGEEGSTTGGTAANCKEAVATAKKEGKCGLPTGQTLRSPLASGGTYACNYHFKDADYDYKKISNLDYPSGWSTEIRASFNGTVTYTVGSNDKCGNQITLSAAGGRISICHAKDFTDSTGKAIASGTVVKQGDVLGHLGGNCCQGETPPSHWKSAQNGWCKVAGTKCTDPSKMENCACQPWQQSGNTSGPHVHITYNFPGDILACLE